MRKAQDKFDRGIESNEKLRFEDAAKLLKRAIKSGYNKPEVYSALAISCINMGSISRAVGIAEYLSEKGHDLRANFISGMAFLAYADMAEIEANTIFTSKEPSRKSVTVDLNGKEVTFDVSQGAQVRNKVEQIKSYLSSAIECFEASGAGTMALFYTGLAYLKKNEYGKAIEKYEQALGSGSALSNEVKSSITNNIGICHYRQGSADLARKAFNEAMATNSIPHPKKNLAMIENVKLYTSERSNRLVAAQIPVFYVQV